MAKWNLLNEEAKKNYSERNKVKELQEIDSKL